MAKRTSQEEAFLAGQENPYLGDIGPLQRIYGTLGAIGEELSGADMGTPVGTKFKAKQAQTKAEIKRLQELRAKHPEEFGRGQVTAQEQEDPYMLGLGLGAAGGMAPYGRTAMSPLSRPRGAMEMAGGGETPEGIFRSPELSFTPRSPRGRGPGAEGPTINAGFDVPRGMNRFEANQYYFTHGIPGEDIYRRSNYGGELGFTPRGRAPSPPGGPIEMGAPYWPNAVPRDMNRFQSNTYGMTYGRPGNEMYRYSNMDFVPEGIPGEPPRFGTLAPRGSTMPVMTQTETAGIPPGGLPARQGGQVPSYRYVGSEADRFPRGEYQAPNGAYGEFRDVTGDVLRGPAGRGSLEYTPVYEGAPPVEGEFRPGYGGADRSMLSRAAGAAIPGAGMGTLGMMPILSEDWRQREPNRYTLPDMNVGNVDMRGFGRGIPQGMGQGSFASQYPLAPMAPGAERTGQFTEPKRTESSSKVRPKQTAQRKGGQKAATPQQTASTQGDQWEGNLNYYVTRAIDALLGQNEAERGRRTQQYYEKYGR